MSIVFTVVPSLERDNMGELLAVLATGIKA